MIAGQISTVLVLAATCLRGPTLGADALARLQPQRLEAVHKAILSLRSEWRKLDRPGRYQDYRANLHVHSGLSHDSRGTIAEIVTAARAVGTRVLLFTEHPADHYDFYHDGHRGLKDGVLLIPGAESGGFLLFPTHSLRGLTTGSPQELADLVRRRDGLVFLCHLEERMDWNIRGLTGCEIYNTHANFKEAKKLQAALRNPLWLLQSATLFQKYPQEAFSAILDYPADYLRRWDELCLQAPHAGVAANDAHQNLGVTVRLVSKDKVLFEDALGKKVFELDGSKVPLLGALTAGKKPGEVLFRLLLDPYENSLRHVGTHLLMTELSQKAVWETLKAGRAYVAFDWLADATGFEFGAHSAGRRFEMGSRLPWKEGIVLTGRAPLSGRWKLFRNGKAIATSTGRESRFDASEPGNYRVEVWLNIAGEEIVWILSNPVYLSRSTD
jgi:hypothetical protein